MTVPEPHTQQILAKLIESLLLYGSLRIKWNF